MFLILMLIAGIFIGCSASQTPISNDSTAITDVTDSTSMITETESVEETAPVEVVGVRSGKNFDGTSVIVVEYSWTNLSDDSVSFLFTYADKVYQNDIECESAYVAEDNSNDINAEIKPNASLNFTRAYCPRDTESDINIVVTDLFGIETFINIVVPYSEVF